MAYQELNTDRPPAQPQPPAQGYSFVRDDEYDPYDDKSSRSALNSAIVLLVFTSVAYPLVGGLISKWYLGIVGAVVCIAQLVIGGFICLNRNSASGIKLARVAMIAYTCVLLLIMVAFEAWSLYDKSRYNWSRCEDYVMYTICRKRGGLMTTELILAIFYPFIDFMALAGCFYVLRCIRDRKESLQRRQGQT